MSSSAYQDWIGARRAKIDQLFSAHALIGGSRPGRRWQTEQLNWSITFRLAGEFQGFARELHSQAVDFMENSIASTNPALAKVVSNEVLSNRQLDRGNANPGAIGSDFSRIGLLLWPSLATADRRANRWNSELETLNLARNAIAHDDQDEFFKLGQAGKLPITLTVVRTWRRALDSLATTMDDVVGDYLSTLLGVPRPW
jgi:hypothetical protein